MIIIVCGCWRAWNSRLVFPLRASFGCVLI
jgi:hypothetical protein